MEIDNDGLTPKQAAFVRFYLEKNFNGKEAAIAAGYAPKAARQKAWDNLQKPKIQKAVQELVQEILGPIEKDIVENVKFWIKTRDDENVRRADRLKAAEHLAKYRGLFVEKKEHSGEVAVNILDDI